MNVLVTGGAGFVGSNLCEALLKRGDTVYCLDDLSTGLRSNMSDFISNDNFTFREGNILDALALEELISKVDVVFHLAAAVGVKYIVDDPLKGIITNVHGTENVLRIAYKYDKKKVIVISSSEIYGKSRWVPYKEDDDRLLGSIKLNRWSYAASKALDEHMAFCYAKMGLPAVVLRFFNVYGPRMNEAGYGSVMAQFIKQALCKQPITVHGSGQQSRSFTYVDDIVRGVIASSEVDSAVGEVFNVGNGRPTRIMGLAELVKKSIGSSSEIVRIPYEEYYGKSYEDAFTRCPDITKARKVLGYNPRVPLEEGIAKTITWCARNYKWKP